MTRKLRKSKAFLQTSAVVEGLQTVIKIIDWHGAVCLDLKSSGFEINSDFDLKKIQLSYANVDVLFYMEIQKLSFTHI